MTGALEKRKAAYPLWGISSNQTNVCLARKNHKPSDLNVLVGASCVALATAIIEDGSDRATPEIVTEIPDVPSGTPWSHGMKIDSDAPVQAQAELPIDAPLDQVWSLLTDISAWSRWNPGVNRVVVKGPIAAGTEFTWRSGRVPIASKLVQVAAEAQIAWTGRSLGMDAVHVWTFEARDGSVMAHTEESLDGLLARWMQGRMQRMLQSTLTESLRLLASECKRRGRERAI